MLQARVRKTVYYVLCFKPVKATATSDERIAAVCIRVLCSMCDARTPDCSPKTAQLSLALDCGFF